MTAPPPSPPDIEQHDDLDRCLIHSTLEIAAVLNGLRRDGTPLTAYFGGAADCILTTILAVRAAQDELVLEYGSNTASSERALHHGRMKFVAWHERIMIQFAVEELRKTRFEGKDAFSLPLPTSLLRLQRREYFRINTPRNGSIRCIIGPQAATLGAGDEGNVIDISCGGIGLLFPGKMADLEVGTRLPACRILLPEAAEVTTDMAIKSRFAASSGKGRPNTRSGWEFVEIAERDRAPIQRYINKLERERIGRR